MTTASYAAACSTTHYDVTKDISEEKERMRA